MTLNSSEVLTAEQADWEQRSEGRIQTVYLPCCLRTGERCALGLIRNMSSGGLMVETAIEVDAGSEIAYFLEGAPWRRARVAWSDGARLGLVNIDEPTEDFPSYPSRALRIPTSLVGRVWLRGKAFEIGIGNMSHTGVLAFGVPTIEQGQLVTLTIAGRDFANTSVRWWDDGSAGLKFARPMTLRELNELVDLAERDGSGHYFQRRLGELLEVVPANDPRE